MQDRENINKEFVDKQWSLMEEMLDKNLPVRSSSNVSVTSKKVFLTLFLLLIGSISSTIFFAHKYKTIVPTTTFKSLLADRSDQKTEPFILGEKPQDGQIVAEKHLEQGSQNDIISRSDNHIKELAAEPSQDISNTTKINVAEIKTKVSLIEYGNDLIELATEEEGEEKKRNVTIDMGIQTLATSDFDFTGVGVGSSISIPLGRRWLLNTGIGFNVLSRGYIMSSADNAKSRQGISSESAYNALVGLKQLYVPLNLAYGFGNSFAFNSGVRFRYTIEEQTNDIFNNSLLVTRAPAIDTRSFYNDANLGLTAGISYQMTPWLNLQLDSEWGLNSFINRSVFLGESLNAYHLNMLYLSTNVRF